MMNFCLLFAFGDNEYLNKSCLVLYYMVTSLATPKSLNIESLENILTYQLWGTIKFHVTQFNLLVAIVHKVDLEK